MEYLGHKIDATGLHPLPAKVKAIREVPKPQSVHELKSWILTYYGKFLSCTLYPLYRLLQKNTCWRWGKEQEKAFAASKDLDVLQFPNSL